MNRLPFLLSGLLICVLAYAEDPSRRQGKDAFAALDEKEKASIENRVVNDTLRTELKGSRYRIFSTAATGVKTEQGLRRYAYCLIYDYTRNNTYNVVYDITEKVPGKIVEVMRPPASPPPNAEEFEEALALVSAHSRVKTLRAASSAKLQQSFPVHEPPPCDVDRCVEIQVNELRPEGKHRFLLLIVVNLSRREILQVRESSTETSR